MSKLEHAGDSSTASPGSRNAAARATTSSNVPSTRSTATCRLQDPARSAAPPRRMRCTCRTCSRIGCEQRRVRLALVPAAEQQHGRPRHALQRDARRGDVGRLRVVDPEHAVVARRTRSRRCGSPRKLMQRLRESTRAESPLPLRRSRPPARWPVVRARAAAARPRAASTRVRIRPVAAPGRRLSQEAAGFARLQLAATAEVEAAPVRVARQLAALPHHPPFSTQTLLAVALRKSCALSA